ncbi:Retrovirus-related Pol polyprotein from transposon RE1 [Vitis vinifera]|uniref:Retrovirus-related Pol polyprotein from transposon RE1 n=1 Tax=Vitis vinifera TaxID=29760 RepID=A0A438DMI3_VITVI|nr:Retrovirus-related Pol polyprotein from transposon RE1 [Vitis vinifera]
MEESKNSVADIVPIVSKITEHKLNGSNYIEWSKTIKIYLRSVAKDDHLTEEPPKDHTRKLWMQDDARLFLQMKNSINSDIVGLLSHCEFVKELMDYLDFLYSGKGNVSRMYDVWNAFHCPEKGAKSLTAYFMDFKKVYEELNALMPFSPDVRVQQAQREQMVVMSFLSGLHLSLRLQNLRFFLVLTLVPFRKFSVEFYELRMFHLLSTPMFLVAKGENAENARRVNNRGGNRAFENCGNDSISDSSDKIVTMTAEEFSKYSQYQDALKASTPVSALVESGKTCLVSSSNKWIIDSGATDHMTGDHKTFSTFRTHSAPPVIVADGSTYEIKGSGTVKPTSSIMLSSDLMTKRTFGKGHVSDGLYILDEWVPRPVACVSTASPVEAHCRLGHPSLPVLKKLCPQFDTLPSLDCESCHFVKHHRSSLGPRLNKRAESLFELVHSDVWGPCPVTSQTGRPSFFSSPTSSASEEDEEWLVYQVVNSRPTVGQSSVVDSDASLAHLGPVVNIPPAPDKPPIVQVYSRRPVTTDTCPAPAPSSSDPSSDLDLPISLRKGKRHCKSIYSIANFVSYDHLSSSSSVLVASIDSISVPKTVTEALNHPGWKNAMLEEIYALEDNHTWKLVDLPQGKKVVGCKWVFAVKVNPDGSVARLKARLVARGYAQTYGVDYSDTFSPVAKLNSVRLFISIAASQQWMIHQLDIKNAFLHGDLEEEVYLEQPPGFVAQGEYRKVCRLKKALYGLKQSPRAWFGKFSKEIQAFGMNKSEKDHSVFYKKSVAGIILLVVYVDDIVIIGNDYAGISDLKTFMHSKFHTKDLGELKYFLGIEVSRSKKGMFLSQRKYVLDLLKETGKIEAKPCTTPMVPNVQLMPDDGDPFYNPERYRRVVGKLNYLTVTRPDIAYAKAPGLGILYNSQGHTRIECFSDADWAGSKFDRRSTTGYCVFFGGNLVAWKSKKQSVVSRSSAESEYRAMAQATCEIIWIHQLLCEVGMKCTMPAKLWCDNQAALHIAANPVYHERTKHIEVDCHFIREKIEENLVSIGYVKTGEQLGDIFTKALNGTRVEYFCNKLGMINIYAPA